MNFSSWCRFLHKVLIFWNSFVFLTRSRLYFSPIRSAVFLVPARQLFVRLWAVVTSLMRSGHRFISWLKPVFLLPGSVNTICAFFARGVVLLIARIVRVMGRSRVQRAVVMALFGCPPNWRCYCKCRLYMQPYKINFLQCKNFDSIWSFLLFILVLSAIFLYIFSDCS